MMTKSRKRGWIVFGAALLLLIALVLHTGILSVAQAADYDGEQTNVTLTKNYDIQTAEDGVHASYFVTDAWQKYYSDNTAVNFNSGYRYQLPAAGFTSTVRLFDEYTGTFDIIVQGFMEDTYKANVSTGGWGRTDGREPDYKFMNFVFSDKKSAQKIKIMFEQNDNNYLLLSVEYTDAEGNVTQSTSKKDARGSFIGVATASGCMPLKFRYNTATQTVNLVRAGLETAVAWSWQDIALNGLFDTSIALPTFETYSLDIEIAGKNEYNTANFIIYELCSQKLSGASLTDTAAPIMLSMTLPEAPVKNAAYDLSAKAYDVADGKITSGFDFVVTDPHSNVVTDSEDSSHFVPTEEGTYTIECSVTDQAGKKSNVLTKTVTVAPDTQPPVITVQGTYVSEYWVGYTLPILFYEAVDNVGVQSYNVSITRDGAPIEYDTTNNTLDLSQVGSYTITYSATDVNANTTTKDYTFEVKDVSVSVPETVAIEASKTMCSLPQIEVPSNWHYTYELYKSDDKDNALQTSDGKYLFNAVGSYEIVYKVIPFGFTEALFEYKTSIEIQDTIKPVVSVVGNYQNSYALHSEVEILEAVAEDNAESVIITVKAYFGTEELAIDNNKIKLEKAGDYKVVYVAQDASGNISDELTFAFSAQVPVQPPKKSSNGIDWWVWVLIAVGASGLIAGGVVLTIKVIIPRIKKQKGEADNESKNNE